MSRQVDFNKTYILRQYKDDQGATQVGISVEGSASDPDATNEFDKGPHALQVNQSIPYNPDMTLAQLAAAALVKLEEAAGL